MGLPVDGRSDLFSAGVILYQFLTGERPFSGSAATTMQKVLKEDPLPPSSLNIQVLPVMDSVVRKALAKNADERYQTAQEFADAIGAAASTTASLAAAARAGSTDATIIVPLDSATPKPAAGGSGGAPPAIPARPQSPPLPPPDAASAASARNPALVVVIVAAAIAIGAGAWFAYQRFGRATRIAQTPAPNLPVVAQVPPPCAASRTRPGTLKISAVGLVDPSDSRYNGDKAPQQPMRAPMRRARSLPRRLGCCSTPSRSIRTTTC
jgi:serine/threonine-protein kinase